MRFQGIMHDALDGGSKLDESIRSRDGWQDDDAAFCQITLDSCFNIGHKVRKYATTLYGLRV